MERAAELRRQADELEQAERARRARDALADMVREVKPAQMVGRLAALPATVPAGSFVVVGPSWGPRLLQAGEIARGVQQADEPCLILPAEAVAAAMRKHAGPT